MRSHHLLSSSPLPAVLTNSLPSQGAKGTCVRCLYRQEASLSTSRWTTSNLSTRGLSSSTQRTVLFHPLSLQSKRSKAVNSGTSTRPFSTTPSLPTRLRRDMYRWLSGTGRALRQPLPNSTNYISAYDASGGLIRAKGARVWEDTNDDSEKRKKDQTGVLPPEELQDLRPFPMNWLFQSQAVLSDQVTDEIFQRAIEENEDIRSVSADLGVEMRRVAAVVRLKAVEKDWADSGKPMALPYARAVRAMLPTTKPRPEGAGRTTPHEPINDLPVHRSTARQVFHPVAESRHFTRSDAGELFESGLLPADQRIPHPQLVDVARWTHQGVPRTEIARRRREAQVQERLAAATAERKRQLALQRSTSRVQSGRWEFRFRQVNVDERVGENGRGRFGVGERYGMPSQERKKGRVKIPTRVE